MICAVYNPVAGSGQGEKTAVLVEQKLRDTDIPFQMLRTERPGHATALSHDAALHGAETVLSIGGDGTALEVAQGLLGTKSALGVIPAGTGNDFIKTIGLPKNPMDALAFILSHPPQPTDVGEINGRLFLNEIGTGFDVSVLDYALKAKKYCRGLLPYLYGVVKTLLRFHSVPITYAVGDGEPQTRDAFVMGVANGGVIGGGIRIAPEARADDGLLDIVLMDKIDKRLLILRLVALMQGKILTFPETHFVRAASVTFSSPHMRLNVDGEIIPEEKAAARILPGALMIHR